MHMCVCGYVCESVYLIVYLALQRHDMQFFAFHVGLKLVRHAARRLSCLHLGILVFPAILATMTTVAGGTRPLACVGFGLGRVN